MTTPRVIAVCRSQCTTDPKVDVGEGELRAGYGLVGDAHASLSEREVSLLAVKASGGPTRSTALPPSPAPSPRT